MCYYWKTSHEVLRTSTRPQTGFIPCLFILVPRIPLGDEGFSEVNTFQFCVEVSTRLMHVSLVNQNLRSLWWNTVPHVSVWNHDVAQLTKFFNKHFGMCIAFSRLLKAMHIPRNDYSSILLPLATNRILG